MRDLHKVERQKARKQIDRQLAEYQSIGYEYFDLHEKSLKEFEKEYEKWATVEDLDKYLAPI